MANYRSPHDSNDHQSQAGKRRALIGAIVLSLIAFVVQMVGAIYSGSLALLGDTAHLFTDLLSLIMALVAVILAARPSNQVQSFGLYRLEVLASFLNGITLLVAGLGLAYEAIERFFHPTEILTVPLIIVAVIGLALNLLSALFLSRAMKGDAHAHHHHHHHGHSHGGCGHNHGDESKDGHAQEDHGHGQSHNDRNLQAALLHVLTDALSSVAVVIGAIIAYYTHWLWVDPALALFLSLMIVKWSWALIHDSGLVLLESTPRHLDSAKILKGLQGLDARVKAVEDLHVWEITSRMYAATADVRVGAMSLAEAETLRQRMDGYLKESFGIAHATLALKP
jgi:cobalt-zinc-cadmium efflux system protein